MSYKINTTDGSLLVDLVDGRADAETTDLTLVGRNYTGYGEAFNENFIKLLENFAGVSQPEKPIVGQIWYDKSDGRLKVYNGIQFRSADTTVVSATQPTMLAGDIWIDSTRKQIYFNDGSATILAGPIYTELQQESGFRVESILDRFGNLKTVLKIMIGADVVAIVSKEKFTTANVEPGFGKEIEVGINIHTDYTNFQFFGISSSTRQLVGPTGQVFTTDSFLKTNQNNVSLGSLYINNNGGVTAGTNADIIMRVESGVAVHRIQNNNQNYKLKVRISNTDVDAISVNTADMKLGIWNSTPQYSLDVAGSLRVTGDLIVEGNTTAFEVENLRIQDKQIELAVTEDSTVLDDTQLNNAGIIIRSLTGDKTLTWTNVDNSWGVNTNFSIPDGFAYKVDNSDLLSKTTLSSSVTSALGLLQIGHLIGLDVDSFNFNNSTLTVQGSFLVNIASSDAIVLQNNNRITNVGAPAAGATGANDATNRTYVDSSIKSQNIYLSLDITGFTNVDAEIISVLENMISPTDTAIGRLAVINTVKYDASVTVNPGDGITELTVAVDSGGTFNTEEVLKDLTFANITETVNLTVTRSIMQFEVDLAGNWTRVL